MDIIIRASHTQEDMDWVFPFVRASEQYYPNLIDWWYSTALPEVTGEDNKATLYVAQAGPEFAGCLITRNYGIKKIRTVCVPDAYWDYGSAVLLFHRAHEDLHDDDPLFTICEERFHHWSGMLVNVLRYKLTDVAAGMYRGGVNEYVFNG